MTLKFSAGVRNAQLDAIETTVSTGPYLNIWTAGAPANITDGATGTLIFNYLLPADWMAAANAGSKAKNGTWSGSAVDTGTAGYFRILTAGSVACIQGTCSGSAGGGDMILDNPSLVTGQTVTINTFTLTAGNA
jgi:hypothetical protein